MLLDLETHDDGLAQLSQLSIRFIRGSRRCSLGPHGPLVLLS